MSKVMSKEDWLHNELLISEQYGKYIEVMSTTGYYATISITEIQYFISKLYLTYNDSEAKEFLENLEV